MTSMKYTCERCKTENSVYDSTLVDGEAVLWCHKCLISNLTICSSCAEYTQPHNVSKVYDERRFVQNWCLACMINANECERCSNFYEERMTVVHTDGYANTVEWCQGCIEDHAYLCNRCETYNNDTPYEIKGYGNIQWCETCISEQGFYCTSCDNNYDASDRSFSTFYVEDINYSICHTCYEEGNYFYCEGCENIYSDRQYAGNGFCSECYEENLDGIEDYEADVLDDIYGLEYDEEILTGTTKPYMGVELEVSIEDNAQFVIEHTNDIVRHKGKWGILKKDGSISHGFEMVSVPMLLEDQHAKWGQLFNPVNSDVTKNMNNNSGSAGMHIHLNRNSLTNVGLARLLFLVYGQKENKKFIEFIAERKPNSYWSNSPQDIKNIYKNRSEQVRRGRFEAINLKNINTVEFRFFNSIPNIETIYKNTEFVDAAQNFCNNEIFIRPTWKNFAEWVIKTQKYPTLSEFVKAYINQNTLEDSSANYMLNLFKISSRSIIYYKQDSDGGTVFCTEDGMNWWVATSSGIITPLCGEVPQSDNFKFLPIEKLNK